MHVIYQLFHVYLVSVTVYVSIYMFSYFFNIESPGNSMMLIFLNQFSESHEQEAQDHTNPQRT